MPASPIRLLDICQLNDSLLICC